MVLHPGCSLEKIPKPNSHARWFRRSPGEWSVQTHAGTGLWLQGTQRTETLAAVGSRRGMEPVCQWGWQEVDQSEVWVMMDRRGGNTRLRPRFLIHAVP